MVLRPQEAAWKVTDECIQILGGMGFMKVPGGSLPGVATVGMAGASGLLGVCALASPHGRSLEWSVFSEIFAFSGSLRGQTTSSGCLWLCRAVW